jgi:hypothetical protein
MLFGLVAWLGYVIFNVVLISLAFRIYRSRGNLKAAWATLLLCVFVVVVGTALLFLAP